MPSTINNRRALTVITLAMAGFMLASAAPAAAMRLNPNVFDFSVNPGETAKDAVTLTNDQPYALTVTPVIMNFTRQAGDEVRGIPVLYPASENRTGRELAPWMTVDARPVTLLPGERWRFPFRVSAPKDAEPGSRFGAIVFRIGQPGHAAGASVGLSSGAAALLLVRVNGAVVESLQTQSFGGGRRLYTSLPIDLTTRLKNTGSVHLRPAGQITIIDMFGREAAKIDVNPSQQAILPDTTRRFDLRWMSAMPYEGRSEFLREWNNFAFGKHTATMVVRYGMEGRPLAASYEFWVIPWMVLGALSAGTLILLAALVLLLRKFKK